MKHTLSSNQLTDEAIRLRRVEYKLSRTFIPDYCSYVFNVNQKCEQRTGLVWIKLNCPCGCSHAVNPCLDHLSAFLEVGYTQEQL